MRPLLRLTALFRGTDHYVTRLLAVDRSLQFRALFVQVTTRTCGALLEPADGVCFFDCRRITWPTREVPHRFSRQLCLERDGHPLRVRALPRRRPRSSEGSASRLAI